MTFKEISEKKHHGQINIENKCHCCHVHVASIKQDRYYKGVSTELLINIESHSGT